MLIVSDGRDCADFGLSEREKKKLEGRRFLGTLIPPSKEPFESIIKLSDDHE